MITIEQTLLYGANSKALVTYGTASQKNTLIPKLISTTQSNGKRLLSITGALVANDAGGFFTDNEIILTVPIDCTDRLLRLPICKVNDDDTLSLDTPVRDIGVAPNKLLVSGYNQAYIEINPGDVNARIRGVQNIASQTAQAAGAGYPEIPAVAQVKCKAVCLDGASWIS